MMEDAKEHNYNILKLFKFDLDMAVGSQALSPSSSGSEFKDPVILEPILHHHHFWGQVQDMLTNGLTSPLEEISSDEWK